MQDAVTQAVAFQRKLAVEEHEASRKAIEDAGCEIVELNAAEHAAFVAAVQPLLADAGKMYGEAMFKMVPKASAAESRPSRGQRRCHDWKTRLLNPA